MNAKLDPQFLRYDLFLNSVKPVDIAGILRLARSGYIGKVAYNPINSAIKQHETCVTMSFFSRIRQVQAFRMILWVRFSMNGGVCTLRIQSKNQAYRNAESGTRRTPKPSVEGVEVATVQKPLAKLKRRLDHEAGTKDGFVAGSRESTEGCVPTGGARRWGRPGENGLHLGIFQFGRYFRQEFPLQLEAAREEPTQKPIAMRIKACVQTDTEEFREVAGTGLKRDLWSEGVFKAHVEGKFPVPDKVSHQWMDYGEGCRHPPVFHGPGVGVLSDEEEQRQEKGRRYLFHGPL